MKVSPEAIYDKIFTAIDPWKDQNDFDGTDNRGSMFADGFKGLNQEVPSAPKDVEVTVECSLAEFYNGSLKSVNYQFDEVQHDARTIKVVDRTHEV